MAVQHKDAVPSTEQYVAAFCQLGSLTDTHIRMLRVHYAAPDQTITAAQMAHAIGYHRYSPANAHYGRLGRLVGEHLAYNPMHERLGTLVTFEQRHGEWHWIMRPEVARALEIMGLVAPIEQLLPEEVISTTKLCEGAVRQIMINAYERNREARSICIEYYGTNCMVCDFNFEEVYGPIGKKFIHIHHLRLLSEINEEYEVNPIDDLRPVCPNCHAIIHRRTPPFSIEEVRKMMKKGS